VNNAQIDRLLAGVDGRHHDRVNGYAAAARRCDQRIAALRIELERTLRAADETAADEAIRLAVELDALERVQPRIDSWLRVAVGAVSEDPGRAPFGEGPA
jgi:hypothetical protein